LFRIELEFSNINFERNGIEMRGGKRLIVLFMILALGAMVFTGCGGGAPDPQDGAPEEPIVMSYDVKIYYVNNEYVETGDENLDPLLVDEKKIEVEEGQNAYIALLKLLAEVPNDEMGTVVTDDIIFNDVYLNEETIVVDLASEGIYGHGGSLTEMLFINQIVATLLENGELAGSDSPPKKVQFLVDGEIVESLMGHITASEPFAQLDL
jgi:germination protein M